MESIAQGVWKIKIGEPERPSPVCINCKMADERYLSELPQNGELPFSDSDIGFKITERGCILRLPLDSSERIFGFGLQLKSHDQTGKKKHLRTNSDPVSDTGDSHAPVPFYVSTKGYGVMVDTARYVTFYCGTHEQHVHSLRKYKKGSPHMADSTESLYSARESVVSKDMIIEIPAAAGADIYFFCGPTMKAAVQRYILFSGGGCIPPYWGLGIWYRAYAHSNMEDVMALARYFRDNNIPCDVLGLEPGWQSHFYSCSFKWDAGRFSEPDNMIKNLDNMNYKINLWEHVFTHPGAPIYEELEKYSCDYEVWGGLVPDLSIPEARRIFSDYHKNNFIKKGISGFKLDECDNSDFIPSPWSFPECTEFPSGLDGERMHSMLGILYQQTIISGFMECNKRTYGQVRSSHALAAPLPFVLYSDLYDHHDFIIGLINSGFTGLLWSPEVRQCDSEEDLIRRIQTVVFSPQAMINGWMIKNPPWLQVDVEKNKQGEFLNNFKVVESICRKYFRLRMSLIPYLYSSFARYRFEGVPPLRALVMEHPEDQNTYSIVDEYYFGDSLIIAPVVAGQGKRKVYLPKGNWYCFWTHRKFSGEEYYDVDADIEIIPVYVKENTLLPIAEPVDYITNGTCFDITVFIFGSENSHFELFEDDGITFDYEKGIFNKIILDWDCKKGGCEQRTGDYKGYRYNIKEYYEVDKEKANGRAGFFC